MGLGDMFGGGGGLGGMFAGGALGDFLGAGLGMFGMGQYKDPSDSAMPYMNQISGELSKYFSPYINAGNQALPQLQSQYGNLMNNPGGFINNMGKQFQQSPGYQWQVGQAEGAANRAAAAGGMLGTPAEQQNISGTVNQMANQDYYNWMNHAMGAYGMGLNGMNSIARMGYGAASGLGEDLASALMSQANLAYAGQADKNQEEQGGLGGIGGLISGGLSLAGAAGWL